MYGHVNNVVYGEWIDSVVNQYLIERCSFEPVKACLVGFVVSSHCDYYSPISYPSIISAGLFVRRLGNSSVDYRVGIFANREEQTASAVGGFTHVFVNRTSGRPQTIPDDMRRILLSISQ
jgi:acyl-CoA thioester hydrolase